MLCRHKSLNTTRFLISFNTSPNLSNRKLFPSIPLPNSSIFLHNTINKIGVFLQAQNVQRGSLTLFSLSFLLLAICFIFRYCKKQLDIQGQGPEAS